MILTIIGAIVGIIVAYTLRLNKENKILRELVENGEEVKKHLALKDDRIDRLEWEVSALDKENLGSENLELLYELRGIILEAEKIIPHRDEWQTKLSKFRSINGLFL
jgi:hypothetical protein